MKKNRIIFGIAFLAMMAFIVYQAQSQSGIDPYPSEPKQPNPRTDHPAQPLPEVNSQVLPANYSNRPAEPLPDLSSGISVAVEHQGEKAEATELQSRFSYPVFRYYPKYHNDWAWTFGYPYYFGYPYNHDYPFSFYDYRAYKRDERRGLEEADMGQIEIHVKPGKAEVYLDGKAVGRASQFDGNPGYLWLKAGDHNLAFYDNGYQTVDREIRVNPGGEYKIKEKMEPGTATSPAMLEGGSKTTG